MQSGPKAFWLSFFLTLAILVPLLGGFVLYGLWQQSTAAPAQITQSGVPVASPSQENDHTLFVAVAAEEPGFVLLRLDGMNNVIRICPVPRSAWCPPPAAPLFCGTATLQRRPRPGGRAAEPDAEHSDRPVSGHHPGQPGHCLERYWRRPGEPDRPAGTSGTGGAGPFGGLGGESCAGVRFGVSGKVEGRGRAARPAGAHPGCGAGRGPAPAAARPFHHPDQGAAQGQQHSAFKPDSHRSVRDMQDTLEFFWPASRPRWRLRWCPAGGKGRSATSSLRTAWPLPGAGFASVSRKRKAPRWPRPGRRRAPPPARPRRPVLHPRPALLLRPAPRRPR